MALYRVSAVDGDNHNLQPARFDAALRLKPGENVDADWAPPALILYRGRKGKDADFWDYGQGQGWVVSSRVALELAGEDWCQLIPFACEPTDPKGKPVQRLERTLLHVTNRADVVIPEKSRFKPYGERVLDFDTPESIAYDEARIPPKGVFWQPSGASYELMCGEAFRALFGRENWTGLRFDRI
ncbi:MAG TPA: hypothetical protein PLX06_00835 [Fimbriimonadaceae bacterium]|nr:hypothetical protein [Fimbriimonadaceae bacterium]